MKPLDIKFWKPPFCALPWLHAAWRHSGEWWTQHLGQLSWEHRATFYRRHAMLRHCTSHSSLIHSWLM